MRTSGQVMAEHARRILVNEQDHQIDLATARGVDVAVAESTKDRSEQVREEVL